MKLIGYCLEDDHRLLVYEFMPKGSMENHLFRSKFHYLFCGFTLNLFLIISQTSNLHVYYVATEALVTSRTGGSHFQPLSWNVRMKVALGAAKGLAFLHNAETQVIYRDFKTSNILLDSVCNTVSIFSKYSIQ